MSEENTQDNVAQESPSEKEARQFGWMPKEEYKGDPEQWKDADTFLQRGKEINGFLRKDLEKIQTTLAKKDAAHEAELAEIRKTMEEFKVFHNKSIEATYKKAIDDLKKEKAKAIEDGDGEKVVEIDEQISDIKEAQKPVTQEEKTQTKVSDTAYYEWLDENQWYITNQEMSKAAEKFGDIILAKNPNLKGREFLDEVSKRVKDAYKSDFENPARSSSSVSSNSDGVPRENSKGKKTFNDLPQEAKVWCDKFIKQGLIKSRDQYLEQYDWS